jgi:hypothetical protein
VVGAQTVNYHCPGLYRNGLRYPELGSA